MTYNDACAMLARGRNGSKKIGNNTYLHRIDANTIGVLLHSTDVVLIHSDNTWTLNSGGWRTGTTKDRMNTYSPARVSQMAYKWYVGPVPYFDGIQVDERGEVLLSCLKG